LHVLDEHGLAFQAQFVHDWSKNLSSGSDADYGFGRYSFDLFANIDSQKSLGFAGGTGVARLKQHINEFGWTDVGASQVLSNIDASSRTTLYELWWQQQWMAGKLRLKGGKIDANTEFAVVENGADFLNSSMGFSPTILAFPTYPEPQPGGAIFVTLPHTYGVGLGVLRSTMGTMSIAEPRVRWALGEGELRGHVTTGYWRIDGDMAHFGGHSSSVTQGWYQVIEQGLWRSRRAASNGSIASFLQLGSAAKDTNVFTDHLGCGFVWTAPLSSRPNDGLGVAATWVQLTTVPAAGFDYPNELVAEGYYKLAINRHFSFVSDLQFFRHPGGLRTRPNVAVFTPRLVVSF